MWQIKNLQVGFKISEDEKTVLNELALSMQTANGKGFSSAKELVFGLITELKTVKNELETMKNQPKTEDLDQKPTENNEFTNEPDLNTENKAIEFKQQLIAAIGYEEIPSDEQLYSDLLEIINMEPDPNDLPIQTVEVIKEVEKPLGENEILVDLTANQHELLQKIARWRSRTKKDEQTLPIPLLIKLMVFNEGTLTNDHGRFETGLLLTKIKS